MEIRIEVVIFKKRCIIGINERGGEKMKVVKDEVLNLDSENKKFSGCLSENGEWDIEIEKMVIRDSLMEGGMIKEDWYWSYYVVVDDVRKGMLENIFSGEIIRVRINWIS